MSAAVGYDTKIRNQIISVEKFEMETKKRHKLRTDKTINIVCVVTLNNKSFDITVEPVPMQLVGMTVGDSVIPPRQRYKANC